MSLCEPNEGSRLFGDFLFFFLIKRRRFKVPLQLSFVCQKETERSLLLLRALKLSSFTLYDTQVTSQLARLSFTWFV